MFKKVLNIPANTRNSIYRRLAQVSVHDTSPKEKWDLCSGVLVERLPILTKTFTPIEKNFQQYLSQIEFEQSLKSDHELQHERDLIQAELIKKGQIEVDLDDTTSKQTAQDKKDAYNEEFNKFQIATGATTTSDNTKDFISSNRNLEETLYLLVEQKLGNKKHLLLPQGKRCDGESMRQVAERVLKEQCGKNIDVTFYGNAPCGFYKYKYPATERKDSVGAKIFFFRCALKNGIVDEKIAKKFEWLNKQNLSTKLQGSYAESVEQFLI